MDDLFIRQQQTKTDVNEYKKLEQVTEQSQQIQTNEQIREQSMQQEFSRFEEGNIPVQEINDNVKKAFEEETMPALKNSDSFQNSSTLGELRKESIVNGKELTRSQKEQYSKDYNEWKEKAPQESPLPPELSQLLEELKNDTDSASDSFYRVKTEAQALSGEELLEEKLLTLQSALNAYAESHSGFRWTRKGRRRQRLVNRLQETVTMQLEQMEKTKMQQKDIAELTTLYDTYSQSKAEGGISSVRSLNAYIDLKIKMKEIKERQSGIESNRSFQKIEKDFLQQDEVYRKMATEEAGYETTAEAYVGAHLYQYNKAIHDKLDKDTDWLKRKEERKTLIEGRSSNVFYDMYEADEHGNPLTEEAEKTYQKGKEVYEDYLSTEKERRFRALDSVINIMLTTKITREEFYNPLKFIKNLVKFERFFETVTLLQNIFRTETDGVNKEYLSSLPETIRNRINALDNLNGSFVGSLMKIHVLSGVLSGGYNGYVEASEKAKDEVMLGYADTIISSMGDAIETLEQMPMLSLEEERQKQKN